MNKPSSPSEKYRPARSSWPVVTMILMLVACLAAGGYFWSQQSQLISKSEEAMDAKGKKVKKVSRRSSNEMTPREEYRQLMLEKERDLVQQREAQVDDLEDRFTLRSPRDLYSTRKRELSAVVRSHAGDGNLRPRSIAYEAVKELRQMEEDPSPAY